MPWGGERDGGGVRGGGGGPQNGRAPPERWRMGGAGPRAGALCASHPHIAHAGRTGPGTCARSMSAGSTGLCRRAKAERRRAQRARRGGEFSVGAAGALACARGGPGCGRGCPHVHFGERLRTAPADGRGEVEGSAGISPLTQPRPPREAAAGQRAAATAGLRGARSGACAPRTAVTEALLKSRCASGTFPWVS